MKSSKRFKLLILTAVLASACTREAPRSVEGRVQRGDLVQRVTVSGTILANRRSVITAPYTGYVQKLYVKVGDKVKEGDPIVSVRPALRAVGEEVFAIRAPLTGTVSQILKLEGESVDEKSGNGLVRIDDMSRLLVQATVPESDLLKIREGQQGLIRASAVTAREYHGVIKSIARAARDQEGWNSARVEFPVLMEITDKDESLRPGMSVLTDIISMRVPNVLTLRLEFLEKTPQGVFVTLPNGSHKQVEIGAVNEEAAEIRRGLAEGERVRPVDFLALSAGQAGVPDGGAAATASGGGDGGANL